MGDVLDKLQSRLASAREWMDRVEEIVPRADGRLTWLRRFRSALDDDNDQSRLVSLVSEGSRIPVTTETMTLLQVEIDARNWASRARPWIPEDIGGPPDGPGAPSRRGKVDDVEDHLERASAIRDRLGFEERKDWKLDGEEDLAAMIQMAEVWYEKVRKSPRWRRSSDNYHSRSPLLLGHHSSTTT